MHPPVHAVASRHGQPQRRWSSGRWHQELQRTPRVTVVTRNWSCHGHLFEVFKAENNCHWNNYRRTALFVQRWAPCWLLNAICARQTTVGGALSETVARVSLRTEKMFSMFQLRNKKCSPWPDQTNVVLGRNITRNGSGTVSIPNTFCYWNQ